MNQELTPSSASSSHWSPRRAGLGLGVRLHILGAGGGLVAGFACFASIFAPRMIATAAEHPNYADPTAMIIYGSVVASITGIIVGLLAAAIAWGLRAAVRTISPSVAIEAIAVAVGALLGAGIGYLLISFGTDIAVNLYYLIVAVLAALLFAGLSVNYGKHGPHSSV